MRFRRKGRPPTKGGWTKESSAKAHAAKARKRMESPPSSGPRRVPMGEHLGFLTWIDSSGSAHRWTIKQGSRANNITVHAKGRTVECGWDKLMRSLRKHLSIQKRLSP